MAEEKQEKAESKRAARRRKWETPARVIGLLGGLFWLVIFILTVQTGYLTWIGITVGSFIFIPVFISPILGLAGKKRIEKVLNWLWAGMIILVILFAVVTLIRPRDNHTWRPYRFDAELAALETKRNVPDEENAALRYESLFTKIDVNDTPDFFEQICQQPWTSNDFPQASKWLDGYSGIIDELLQIGTMEKCRWPVHAYLFDDYTIPYKPLQYSARLLVAAGNRDLGEKQFQYALEKSFCLLRMAEHFYQQTQTLDFYYVRATEMGAFEIIRHILVQNNVPQESIEQINGHLPSTANTWRQYWSGMLEFEKLRYMNLMAGIYEINEEGNIRFVAGLVTIEDEDEPEPSNRLNRLWRIYHLMNMPINPKGIKGIADRFMSKFNDQFKPGNLMRDGEIKMPSFWSWDSLGKLWCNCFRWGIETIMYECGGYTHLQSRYYMQITQRRGTWLILGLRKYRDEHGTWPESFEQISEYVLAEAFIDITNNNKFVYIREGDSFRLYSKGFNGIDEAGRNDYIRALKRAEDDIAIWPLRECKSGGNK